ncbi:thiamine-phosphate kinase [Psychromonas sp. RZ22]|uniref:thiamine-phosphate kinase n=1 Tax=Psychromonas algarum TaxID=2555643 RepID=UPI0010683852|nr:thiamine-phosphate kinase [Psychromonas sp. RZ22]TEW54996.1 thiamine-phosphate kinase [Psychromonas sp. RZ22]
MSKGEFDIIQRYFQRPKNDDNGVVIGIGDDCAILDIPQDYQLAVTTDSLVSGVHFFEDVDPYRLGYKSLAVNLSDLAAMGATAKWVSLAITLPSINEVWLAEFCRGFFALADQYNVQLVGGDTTKGPLSITVSAKGLVKKTKVLTRNNAKVGDIICVSGSLGDGAVGLSAKLESLTLTNPQPFIDALELTEPRLALAKSLVDHASSCIDISDGLSQDLSHILKQSQCYAEIALDKLPLSDAMLDEIKSGNITKQQAWQFAINGGDDYELLFTISAEKLIKLRLELNKLNLSCFDIGTVTQQQLVNEETQSLVFTYKKQAVALKSTGWDHFK